MFGFLKKLFQKKMAIPTEQIEEIRTSLAKVPAYQWIKTENVGQVVHFADLTEDGGILFVDFDNGTRVNLSE